jgi:hypothetical protein
VTSSFVIFNGYKLLKKIRKLYRTDENGSQAAIERFFADGDTTLSCPHD